MVKAYTMGVGRETTAQSRWRHLLAQAYTMGVGRETTAGLQLELTRECSPRSTGEPQTTFLRGTLGGSAEHASDSHMVPNLA